MSKIMKRKRNRKNVDLSCKIKFVVGLVFFVETSLVIVWKSSKTLRKTSSNFSSHMIEGGR
jgi:hypothetical protein